MVVALFLTHYIILNSSVNASHGLMSNEILVTESKAILICQSLKHWNRIACLMLLRERRAVVSYIFVHNEAGVT